MCLIIGVAPLLAACLGPTPNEIRASKLTSYNEGFNDGYAKAEAEIESKTQALSSQLSESERQRRQLGARVDSLKNAMRNFARGDRCVTYEEKQNGRVALSKEYGC